MNHKKYGPHLKQPSVISVFFATEMWERFGFYMIQGLLILYMTSDIFRFSDDKSYAILGGFTALAYITPILGGYVATRVLDFEHSIILGGLMLAVGYAFLAIPDQHLFMMALAIISIGNGFFKPNISTYLGSFYRSNAPHREKGYTIFYIGINFGILLSTSTSGYIVRYFGWHAPFLLSSIGLCVGTVTFLVGLYFLKKTGRFRRVIPSIASKSPLATVVVYLSAIALIFVSYEVIKYTGIANILMLLIGALIFFGLFFYACQLSKMARNKMLACIFLILTSIIFWAIYFQMFFSMSLFIERAVDRHFFNFTLPAPLFISVEAIFVVLVGLVLAVLWQALAIRGKNPGMPLKFALSMLALFAAFLTLYIGVKDTGILNLTNKLFVILAYFFVAVGELLLSPIGLSMVTVLAPQKLTGLMMGVWFVALGLGVKLGSVIADYAAIPDKIHTITKIDFIYGHAFLMYAGLSLAFGLVCFAAVPFLNRLIVVK